MIRLMPITRENCQKARVWRNEVREALRTPIMLTEQMQDDFFDRISHNRNSEDSYWEIHEDEYPSFPNSKKTCFLGIVGLTDWERTNSLAEISLFLDPQYRRRGIGSKAVNLALEEAFDRMNLHQVLGECFYCNPCLPFWEKITRRYGGTGVILPDRKYWDGKYWNSYYFAIFEERWHEARNKALLDGSLDASGIVNRIDGPVCPTS